MKVRDLIGCEMEAKPSTFPNGLVWLDVTHDQETEEHAMTADAAETLGRELIEVAQRVRAAGANEPSTHSQPDPPLPRRGFDPKASWHTDSDM
jgi:hypothetical protein